MRDKRYGHALGTMSAAGIPYSGIDRIESVCSLYRQPIRVIWRVTKIISELNALVQSTYVLQIRKAKLFASNH